MAYSSLKINGIAMPTPALEGITIKKEKIWSESTGRTDTGKMAGTIIAIKRTLSIQWPPLTAAEAALVDQAVSTKKGALPVEYTTEGGTSGSGTFYASTPTYTQYSWVAGKRYVTGVSVELIEI